MSRMIVIRNDANGQPVNPDKAPSDLLSTATKLRTSIKQHEAIFHGNRTEYFKGRRAIDALLHLKNDPKNTKKSDDASMSKEEATRILSELMEFSFFFRVEKQAKRSLEVDSKQYFEEDAYYIWQWDTASARLKAQIYSFLLVAVVLLVVMFPLWPPTLRIGVWYLSMAGIGLVVLLFVIAIIRLILYAITLILPFTRPGIWLFPNLFADVGFVDSFIPVWGWQGVDYEQMHLEKYRKKKKGESKKSKNPAAADTSLGTEDGDGDEQIEEINAD